MKKTLCFGIVLGLVCFVSTSCFDEAATAESQGTNSAAKPPSPNRKAQDRLIEAVRIGDLKAVEQALAAGAAPDAGATTNDRPITVAVSVWWEKEYSEDIERKLQVFAALCRNLRHRDRQIVELTGKAKVTLVSMGAGQYYAEAFIETSDGKSHQIEVAIRETTFRNMNLNEKTLALRFDDSYRVRGSFADEKFEVEELELLVEPKKETSSEKPKKGMSIPVPNFFPSSAKFIQPFMPPKK